MAVSLRDYLHSASAGGGRRFPKELADDLEAALTAVRGLDRDLLSRYLEIVRTKPKRPRRYLPIAAPSAHPSSRLPPHPNQVLEVPSEWFERIIRLDVVFKRLHHFRVAPADWIAGSVSKAAINAEQRRRAKKPRKRTAGISASETTPKMRSLEVELMNAAFRPTETASKPMKPRAEEVAAFLKRKRYLKADKDEKGVLIKQAMADYEVSRRTVFNAVTILLQGAEKSQSAL